MEVIAIGPQDRSRGTILVDQMRRLRARASKDCIGWGLTVVGRQEIDALCPPSILVPDCGQRAGRTGVLPAAGPETHSGTFAFLATTSAYSLHSRVLAISPLCVDTSAVRLTGSAIHLVHMASRAGILEWADAGSYLEIVTVTDVRLDRIRLRVGPAFRRLRKPALIGGNTQALDGIVGVNAQSVQRVRATPYRSTSTKLNRAV